MLVFDGLPSANRPARVAYLAAVGLIVINYQVATWRAGVSRKAIVIAILAAAVAFGVGGVAYSLDPATIELAVQWSISV